MPISKKSMVISALALLAACLYLYPKSDFGTIDIETIAQEAGFKEGEYTVHDNGAIEIHSQMPESATHE